MMHEGGGEGVDKEERTVWGGVKGGLARWSIRWRAQEGKISVGGGYCDGGEKCFFGDGGRVQEVTDRMVVED